ncbi:PRELI-like family-domain-containing protein [Zopfochytrium polystomum]|nr:PRELI-like family-domain-containing protein [Zopfochytrium polystomum]
MVHFWSHSTTYDYPWSTVTQAIWQKYPNPFAAHVLSSDVIDRYVDENGVLHSTRLFTKEGKLPKWGKALIGLPVAYIVEFSTLDPKTRTFTTINRNLSHAKLMLVEERQVVRCSPTHHTSTILSTEASIVSNTSFVSIRSRIEGFGLKRLKENTLRVSTS